jgi:tetratricopeptide repeat protein 8
MVTIIPPQVATLNLAKYAKKPAIGKALCDYLIYVARDPKKALELCAEATQAAEFKDW